MHNVHKLGLQTLYVQSSEYPCRDWKLDRRRKTHLLLHCECVSKSGEAPCSLILPLDKFRILCQNFLFLPVIRGPELDCMRKEPESSAGVKTGVEPNISDNSTLSASMPVTS